MSAGLLVARLILGLGLAAHGSQKLFGWFGGGGPGGTGDFFEGMGFRPGRFFALGAALCEFLGGILVAAGFLGGIGPALMIIVMLVAILAVHWPNGFFADKRGWELPAIYIAGALAIDFGGFGAYSVDQLIRFNVFATPADRWIIVGAAIVVAVLNVLTKQRPAQSQGTRRAA